MKIPRRRVLQSGIALLATYGCGSPPEEGGPPTEDAGTLPPPRDAGTLPPPPDAGTPDAGPQPPPDAGTPRDAGTPPPPPTVKTDLLKFPQGAWAGSLEPSEAVLTTRYSGTRPLRLRLWEAAGGKQVFDGLLAAPRHRDGAYCRFASSEDPLAADHVALRPGTAYGYRFYEEAQGDVRDGSRIGFFRTLAAPGSYPVVQFAAGACNKALRSKLPALSDAADWPDLDFFIHLGDSIYADEFDPRTYDAYNGVYEQFWENPGWRDLHAATGMMPIWDDHEFRNDPLADEYDSPAGRAARDAYFLNHGLRRQADPAQLYRSFKQGQTAEFFLLDLRQGFRPGLAEPRIMSLDQMAWLKAALSASTAKFKILVAPRPISDFPGGGAGSWAFTAQRAELLSHITSLQAQGASGFFFLGGDVHFSSAGYVNAPDHRFGGIPEFVIGPLGNPYQQGLEGRGTFPANTGQGKQLHFHTGHNNHAKFTLRWNDTAKLGRLEVEYCVIDGNLDATGALTGRRSRYRATYNLRGERIATDLCVPDMWTFSP